MRYAIVTFNRGSGSCYDEEVRLFRAKTQKKLEENINKHYQKYFKGWGKYIDFVADEDFDQEDSMHVSAQYS